MKTSTVSWSYGLVDKASPRNDEEVITLNLDKLGDGYAFVYLYADDFEPHLGRFDQVKAAEYRLFDPSTNVNFISSHLGGYHEGMFAVNPDDLRTKQEEPDNDGEAPPPPPKLVSIVGCFLVYQNKGSVVVDHLNSACFDRLPEGDLIGHAVKSLSTTNMSGDLKGLQAFWSKALEKKKQESVEKKKDGGIKLVGPSQAE
jgi:hypothetical protein